MPCSHQEMRDEPADKRGIQKHASRVLGLWALSFNFATGVF